MVSQPNIVLENMATMLHLRTLLELRADFEEWEENHRKSVEFFTFAHDGGKLIPLEEVVEKVRELDACSEDSK